MSGFSNDCIPPALISDLGPPFVAVVITSMTFTLLVRETWSYYLNYQDGVRLKLLVGTLMGFSFLSLFANLSQAWIALVQVSADTSYSIQYLYFIRAIYNLCFPVISVLSQGFYSRRMWKFMGSKTWIAIVILVFLAANFSLGIAMTVLQVQAIMQVMTGGVPDAIQLTEAWPWLSASIDVLITATLIYRLHKEHIPSAGFNPRTDTMMGRIMVMSVTTAGLTSITAVAWAISVIATNHATQNVQVPFEMVLPQVYSICVVATLNFRKDLSASKGSTGGPVVAGRMTWEKDEESAHSGSGSAAPLRLPGHVWKAPSTSKSDETVIAPSPAFSNYTFDRANIPAHPRY